MKRSTLVAGGVAGLVVAGGVTAGAVALTAGEDEIADRGTCAGTVHELTVERDDDRPGLEVSFELQSVGPGETWLVTARQGDTLLFEGERTTDADGELDVDVPAAERDGRTFTVDHALRGGPACTASLTR